jgi:hypothetical protein
MPTNPIQLFIIPPLDTRHQHRAASKLTMTRNEAGWR